MNRVKESSSATQYGNWCRPSNAPPDNVRFSRCLPGVPHLCCTFRAGVPDTWVSLSQTSMSLGHPAPPGSKFRIGDGIRLLRAAQRGLQVSMAQPLADAGEADASVDELRRVGMAQLVQGGVDTGGSTVPDL